MNRACRAAAAPVVLLILFVLGLSACTASDHSTGIISGRAEPCVGPYIPHAHYIVPFVRVTAGTRIVAMRKSLTKPFRFKFTVPPGTYRVSAATDGSTEVDVVRDQVVSVVLHNSCN